MTTQRQDEPHGEHNLIEEHDQVSDSQDSESPDIDSMTLSELIGAFITSPRATYRALQQMTPARDTSHHPAPAVQSSPSGETNDIPASPAKTTVDESEEDDTLPTASNLALGLRITAFFVALVGCVIMISADVRTEAEQLMRGGPIAFAGFLLWLLAEYLNARTRSHLTPRHTEDTARTDNPESPDTSENAGLQWTGIHPVRVLAGLAVLPLALITWFESAGNQFRTLGTIAWVTAIILVIIMAAPQTWHPKNLLAAARQHLANIHFRPNWTFAALLVIMIIGAIFRLYDLADMPPQMTSDHVEKLLDSQRVRDGARDIFFINNGGREVFQMYAMAAISYLPGLEINYITLKLLAVFESLITLPILWLMGREVMGERNRRLGNIVGLLLAALVAVSYWHVAITRLALRIVLTPLVAALLVIFLSRGMRHNRRGDFILAGLILGFGLYTYQAVRMLPVVVLVGVGIAFFYHLRNVAMRQRYILNLAALVTVAFIVFIPLFRFSIDAPDAFWMRTAGRLLGDVLIQDVDEAGNIIQRNATIAERLEAFGENIPALTENIRNALLMFHWKGDVGWISGVPNHPALDSITGALLVIGLAAWLVLIIRQRDPVHMLIPLMAFIMLLPSALSIAMTIENPSATRTSGSLPPIYLLAAFPFALIMLQIRDKLRGNARTAIVATLAAVVILGMYLINSATYFTQYREVYLRSSLPYSEAGRILRGFEMSDGGYGNAFMIAYTHWWDHRAVGMEGGINNWPNGIVTNVETPDFLSDAWLCSDHPYRLNPERDLLFFYHQIDDETEELLQTWFPEGRTTLHRSAQPNRDFKYYRVPAPGVPRFQAFLEEYAIAPRCSM